MELTANGIFTVQITPRAEPETVEGVALGRMALEKTFSGDLVGSSRGSMLTGLTPVEGSAGYVAIERVSGTLLGREGSFLLQHSGLMNRGAQALTISIVPDSGTGALAGIAGSLALNIVEGVHHYALNCTLPK